MQIAYIGHATTLVALDGTSFLTDPLLRRWVAHLRRLHPVSRPEHVDAVLLSHLHADHLDFLSLAKLPWSVPIVAPAGGGGFVRRKSSRKVVELAVGETTVVGGVTVRAVPADHDPRRHPLARRVQPLGFVLEGSRKVYFAGDTDLFPEMADLAPVDVALVPVWGWGSKLPPGHLTPEAAAEAVRLVRPRVAIPIHWGTYRAIGTKSAGTEPPERFQREVARLAPDVDVRILSPGESTDVD
jgi:L-ascorbate metabolism protein UlaG (beta-lactamase superfamily)